MAGDTRGITIGSRRLQRVDAEASSYRWWVLFVTSIGALLASLTSGTLVIALPDILRDLHTDIFSLLSIVVGYTAAARRSPIVGAARRDFLVQWADLQAPRLPGPRWFGERNRPVLAKNQGKHLRVVRVGSGLQQVTCGLAADTLGHHVAYTALAGSWTHADDDCSVRESKRLARGLVHRRAQVKDDAAFTGGVGEHVRQLRPPRCVNPIYADEIGANVKPVGGYPIARA